MAQVKEGVVAFDFDGVIGDSVYECYVQSMKAAKDLGMGVNSSAKVEKVFREGRPLITKPEHFYTILRLAKEHPEINFEMMSQAKFDLEFKKDAKKAEPFLERFYHHRAEMQKISPKEWVALQKSFPKIARFIAHVARGHRVYIATTKNQSAVVDLLARYGIHLSTDRILSKDFSKDTNAQLKEISRRAKVPVGQIVLVEDALKQAQKARSMGAKAVIVPYGYSTVKQRKEAKKAGIPSLNPGAYKKESKKISRMIRQGRVGRRG